MAELSDAQIISEFQDFNIDVKYGSPLLDRLREIGRSHGLTEAELCAHWVAYATQNDDCCLSNETVEDLEAKLHTSIRKTPSSRRTTSKTGRKPAYTHDDYDMLFGENGADDALLGTYATAEDRERLRGQKRAVEQTTPTTPAPKSRQTTQNGGTPVTPASGRTAASPSRIDTAQTPLRSSGESSLLPATPAAKYRERQNSSSIVASLNDSSLPSSWVRGREGARKPVSVSHYDPEIALEAPYQYMFQKVSEKALAVMDRIEELGSDICQYNSLPDPLSVAEHSLEPAVFTGKIACEGEGRLNARSCLLEGPVKIRKHKGCTVKLDIPDSVTCSLFPGQVVAVEGINNYNGLLTPSTIYDQGVLPPAPKRLTKTIPGFTMMVAAGPFTTSDNLDMEPLHDLLGVVRRERPSVLVLFGPFVDSTHESIKDCNLPIDGTFEEFFNVNVLTPTLSCTTRSQTKLVMLPSQRDVHHPFAVYPQPPFQANTKKLPLIKLVSDPCTLSVNGLCLGLTSTDILFHLSARTMFKGPAGDRMARLAGHILRQKCYYPLVPPYRKEDHHGTNGAAVKEEAGPGCYPDDPTEVNLDLIHAFDYRYATLPVRPDLLFLPSDLKAFAKRLEGYICINPGRLTKRASGGTFAKIWVPDLPADKPDFSSDIGIQIVHI